MRAALSGVIDEDKVVTLPGPIVQLSEAPQVVLMNFVSLPLGRPMNDIISDINIVTETYKKHHAPRPHDLEFTVICASRTHWGMMRLQEAVVAWAEARTSLSVEHTVGGDSFIHQYQKRMSRGFKDRTAPALANLYVSDAQARVMDIPVYDNFEYTGKLIKEVIGEFVDGFFDEESPATMSGDLLEEVTVTE